MTFLAKGKSQHKVVFKKRQVTTPRATAPAGSDNSTSSTLNRLLSLHAQVQQETNQLRRSGFNINETSRTGREALAEQPAVCTSFSTRRPTLPADTAPANMIPDTFTTLPPIRDLLNTGTSQLQDETISECLPFLSGKEGSLPRNQHGVPHLDRKRHIQFLHKSLQRLPAPYVAADASRPWMLYWALAGLATMGEDISGYRERIISTVRPMQDSNGGFGGGNGQMSHLAPTYAVVLALAMAGGKEALDVIDRKSMWKWLSALKMPDGGFRMSIGGEMDIR